MKLINKIKEFLKIKKDTIISIGLAAVIFIEGVLAADLINGTSTINGIKKIFTNINLKQIEKTVEEPLKDDFLAEEKNIEKIKKAPLKKYKLENIKELKITNEDEYISQLTFLNYCPNLKKLTIEDKNQTNRLTPYLATITKTPKLEELTIKLSKETEIYKGELEFLKSCEDLKKVTISRGILTPGCEDYLKYAKELKLTGSINVDINFKKLIGIETLDLSSYGAYDLPIFFSIKDYTYLEEQGIKVKFKDQKTKKDYLECSKELLKIVKSLNLNENCAEEEISDQILIYVTENSEYSKQVSNLLKKDIEHKNLTRSFYKGGYLYGFFKKDKQICGNIAGVYCSLMNLVTEPENCYMIGSKEEAEKQHAWNIVKINDKNNDKVYQTDPTWCDKKEIIEKLKKGENEKIKSTWYHNEIKYLNNTIITKTDTCHEIGEIPTYVLDETRRAEERKIKYAKTHSERIENQMKEVQKERKLIRN